MDLLPKQRNSTKRSGPNDGIGRGMEFAVMVLLFLGGGYLLDRWLGTKPIFMIVLTLLAIIGQFANLYYNYDARMKELERLRSERARGKKATMR
jgi:F0F1-type ATP synthase assembly protein I